MSAAPRSPQQLVQYLRGRGLSTTEIAGELRRSPRMVRKILDGSTSGELYRTTLEQLATTGRATTVPPRRRSKDGSVVRVRGASGAGSVTPADEGGRYTSSTQGGRLRASTSYLEGGNRQHELLLPKSKTAKGRVDANSTIVRQIRAAAKGQSRENQKQVRTMLTFANGRQMEVNTYNASTMLVRIREHGDDALAWFRDEATLRYTNLDVSKEQITGITFTVYEAPKTTAYSRRKAEGRPRQARVLTPAELARQAALKAASPRGGKSR